MNILIGKIGKSILFNRNSWGSIGGDNEAPKFYENLFHRNPQHKFYMLGRCDFNDLSASEKMRINKHSNFIDPWGQFANWNRSFTGQPQTAEYTFVAEFLDSKGVKFDAGIIFAGPTGTSNVAGKSKLMTNPEKDATPLEMLNKYVAPIFSYLNDHRDIPYTLIVNDPRYFPMFAKDLFHWPAKVLSQFNSNVTVASRTTYTNCDVITDVIPEVYSEVETMFLIGLEKGAKADTGLASFFDDEPVSTGKDINFMIVLNEGRPSRFNLLKASILDAVKDVDIYGKWTDPGTIGDKRFKGSLGYHDLQAMLPRVKYTYCIPIKKGWVTSKFWEMAHHGIIPFLHPTYDEQNSLEAPEFLRCKDAAELQKKIDFLERKPEAYQKMRDTLDQMLKDSYYSGERLNAIAMESVKSIITATQ
jgi:hypothetical protein